VLTAESTWTLTESQRLHLEINGYAIIPEMIERHEAEEIRGALHEAEQRFRKDGKMPAGSFCSSDNDRVFRIDNIPHIHPSFHRYVNNPRIIAAVEEMVGGLARLEQSDAHIHRPWSNPGGYGFHRGAYAGFSYQENGLFHYPFVKALTNLTDLGPDDGGTAVIPGSHKLRPHLDRALKEAALEDPALIHQVVAPAGSTLLFFESLLHSSGIIRSGRPRSLIIGGYTPTQFQAWAGYDPEPAFLATLDEEQRARLSGSSRWHWPQKFRAIS
jgi:ectoine hydroxylase-related dioxygenase (phytanoyl-CoA dioxygenase family)